METIKKDLDIYAQFISELDQKELRELRELKPKLYQLEGSLNQVINSFGN